MINRNATFITKIKIFLNILLHYSKYKKLVGEQVEIIKNDGLQQYNNLIGEIGYVCNFEFENFEKPLIVHFPKTKKEYCFGIDELKLFRR